MKKILAALFIAFLALGPSLHGQCSFTGFITINNQGGLDQYFSVCTEPAASITITGPDITSLNALKHVKRVKGSISLLDLPNLTSLAGLDSLTIVEGSLGISSCNGLINLQGLGNLATVGNHLDVSYNNNLVSLYGLNNLQRTGGNLNLLNNQKLSGLTDLENLRVVGGELFIGSYSGGIDPPVANSDSLKTLNGLSQLDTVGTLILGNANSLTNLAGLENVQYIGEIILGTNLALTSLTGLPDLIHFPGSIVISGNPALANLQALSSLQVMEKSLVINLNTGLIDLQGLGNLSSVGYLDIEGNAQLTSLAGLNNLKTIGYDFHLLDNYALTSLSGLASLNKIGGSFQLWSNTQLPAFSGLNSLDSIGGAFSVLSNAALTHFSGLEALKSVGKNMLLQYNPALEDLTGLEDLTVIGGDLTVQNNGNLKNLNGLAALQSVGKGALDSLASRSFIVTDNLTLTTLGHLPGLTTIKGDFVVRQNSALTNLGQLENLQSIGGDLRIRGNPELISLGNLNGLASVGDSLDISYDTKLINLSGLDGLTTIGKIFIIAQNQNLETFSGLNQLKTVDELWIVYNPQLTHFAGLNQLHKVAKNLILEQNTELLNLEGLENLDTVGLSLGIGAGDSTINLKGLENLAFVGEQFSIRGGAKMTALTDFKKLRHVGGNLIINSLALPNLKGLDSLISIGREFHPWDNEIMTDFTGLGNLKSVAGWVWIQNNTSLQNLHGLEQLESVGDIFVVQVNPQLQNLDGLEHLQTIAKSIAIHQNPLLQNVAGLQNLTNVGGEIEFSQNLSLSDCAIFAVCDGLLNQPEKIYIFNNASGCNSPAEVATMCHSVPVLVEVRLDGNADCLLNAADSPLAGVQVRLSSTAQMTLRPTRNDGKAFLHYLDAGAFSLSLPQFPTDHWTVCQEPLNLLPDTILQDTIHATFLLSPVDPCPEMKLDLGMPANFRGCFAKSELEVSVENVGGGVAKGVKIAVVLPAAVELISAVPALSAQSGDTLFFEAGEVQPFAFAKVKLTVHTRCENFLLGQTLCVEAFSSLENTCPVNLPERSEIKLTAECLGDTTVRFTLKNIGDAATQNPHQFKIYRNENLFKTGDFSLDIQASLIENVPADGATYRMEATKLDNGKLTFAALEKCGGLTPGWITAFWLDNNLSGYDFDCRPVLLAYDPNQKTAVPAGAGPDHLLAANRPLQYTIDFQNTGSDTAFRVLIRDVLDNSLEIETFRPGFASHPYTWEIRGNTLEVLFLPIMLPDSNMNEPASHGFFSFEIEQKPNLSDGVTLENTAGIIFDFNPPIVTNTVRHTIGQLTVQVDEPQAYVTLWEVLGNPTRDLATFRATAFIAGEKEFALYNATGQLVRQAQFFGQSFYFQRNGLSAGLYFFRIRDDAGRVFSGRIGLVD